MKNRVTEQLREGLTALRGYPSLRVLRRAGLRAGTGVRIGSHTYIDKAFAWAIEIEDHVTISWGVSITAHDAAARRLAGYTSVEPVRIGRGSYLGTGVIVLPGADIGENCVIGSGSVVRGTIPDGAVAAGVPCRVLRETDELVDELRRRAAGARRFEKNRAAMTAADLREAVERLERDGVVYVK